MTRCYPGKSPSGRGDRLPTPREIALCRFWLEWELRLLRPALVVPVGGLAARHVLGLAPLGEFIGSRFELGDAVAVPLPHPSGASGWLTVSEFRRKNSVEYMAFRFHGHQEGGQWEKITRDGGAVKPERAADI